MNLPDSNKDHIENIISRYRDFLYSAHYSTPTVKNYLSDFRHFASWTENKFQEFKFAKITTKSISHYRSDVKEIFKGQKIKDALVFMGHGIEGGVSSVIWPIFIFYGIFRAEIRSQNENKGEIARISGMV